ncbi:MAG: putative drug exporter of the superfamily, partial [Actinomycetota bacterium]|nr:putative drug exporter of the superfamily [Actinomycetota bacterium]
MSKFLYRLGRFAVRRRRLVLAGWLLALVLLGVGGQVAGGTLRDDIKVPGSGSQQAQDVLTAKFPSQAGSSAQVVVHARTGTLAAG